MTDNQVNDIAELSRQMLDNDVYVKDIVLNIAEPPRARGLMISSEFMKA